MGTRVSERREVEVSSLEKSRGRKGTEKGVARWGFGGEKEDFY